MKTRVITAAAALVVFIPILYFSGSTVFPAAVSIICAVACFELLECFGLLSKHYLGLPTLAAAAACPIAARYSAAAMALIIGIYFLYLYLAGVFFYGKTDTAEISVLGFNVLYVIFGFSSIVLLRDFENLRFFLVFIAAWSSDTFAYFAGRLFGKRKLAEKISPKKTVEGAIGGIFGCLFGFLIYGYCVRMLYGIEENFYVLMILAIAGSLLSMLGDLAASAVKRSFRIKDFGRLFPGHGGVLDRFDSIIPLAIGGFLICLCFNL